MPIIAITKYWLLSILAKLVRSFPQYCAQYDFIFLYRSYHLDLPFWQVVQWEKRVIRMASTSK